MRCRLERLACNLRPVKSCDAPQRIQALPTSIFSRRISVLTSFRLNSPTIAAMRPRVAVALFSSAALMLASSANSLHAQAVRGPRIQVVGGPSLPTGHATVLPGNDDGSTGPVNIGFNLNYSGTTWTQLFVNNNGNLTFGSSLSTFTPFALAGATDRPIIAPFFADVDTRSLANRNLGGAARPAGLGLASYASYASGVGLSAEFGNRSVFSTTWSDVGYFAGGTNLTNTFQVNLIERNDTGNGLGNFDIEFNYDMMQWETGGASGGNGGLGGTSGRAGFSNGDGLPGTFSELFGSGTNGALIDGGPNSLTTHSLGSAVLGRYVFQVRNSDSGVPGLTQNTALLPTIINPGDPANGIAPIFQFNNAVSGRWYDPPNAFGFDYVGLSGTTFTSAGMPTGFLSPFSIFTGAGFGTFLGSFGGGSTVDFLTLTGAAVGAFRLTGINPLVDPNDVNAFPTFLTFSQATGNTFTMQGLIQTSSTVPEPSTWVLVGAGLVGILVLRRRTGRAHLS